MQIHPSSNLIPTQDITNTKFVAVALVLGLKLQKPGVFVTITKEHPPSSGGQAHFLFETNIGNAVARYLEVFETGTADADLWDYLDTLKLKPGVREALEKNIAEALIAYGRKFLDQYQIVVRYVKDEVNRFVVTQGEPVYGPKGEIVGAQDFEIRQIGKGSK